MSSSTSKTQTTTQPTNLQRNQPETLKPAGTACAQQPKTQVSRKKTKTTAIKNSHEALKSIQHEYEQFEVNMDERD